jgi:hypothetical protein
MCGDRQIWPPPSTEIIFEVTVPEGGEEIPVLIRMISPSNNGKATVYWGDGISETVSVPEGVPHEAELAAEARIRGRKARPSAIHTVRRAYTK